MEEKFNKISFSNSKEKEIAEDILTIVWSNPTGFTRTQLKNKLISTLLEKANSNLDEIISKLVNARLIQDIEIETRLRVIKRKD